MQNSKILVNKHFSARGESLIAHIGSHGESVMVVLEGFRCAMRVSDLHVVGHECIAVMVNPVEHLEGVNSFD